MADTLTEVIVNDWSSTQTDIVVNSGYQGPPGPPGPEGPEGPPGPAGTDAGYRHVQIAASATWTIVHNLDRYPAAVVMDSGGAQVYGGVEYPDTNTTIISFSAPFSGTAQLV